MTRKRLTDEEKIAALQAKIARKKRDADARATYARALASYKEGNYDGAAACADLFAGVCRVLAAESAGEP